MRKQTLFIVITIALVLVASTIALIYLETRESYGVDDAGRLHAPSSVDLKGTRALVLENENYSLYRTMYRSQGATIVGNLYVPKNAPAGSAGMRGKGMLLLPGGGVTKEGEANAARAFAHRGFVVLTIDQRGVGETGGAFNSIDQDYAIFEARLASGEPADGFTEIPTNHLLILDALAGIQYLREQPEVRGKVLLTGESMGARAAIVAARMSDDISGLLVISSAGFGDPQLPQEQKRFLDSFNPDANIGQVKVPILFLHSTNDTTIPIQYARSTFDRASEPKLFLTVDGCPHGYCAAMEPLLDEALPLLSSSPGAAPQGAQ
jgi:pimeloyl-ACP methyl ester carboxylesterase